MEVDRAGVYEYAEALVRGLGQWLGLGGVRRYPPLSAAVRRYPPLSAANNIFFLLC